MISTPGRLPEETGLHLETTPIHIRAILAATDFSEQATRALKIAARLAKQFKSQLHVLYAEPSQIYALGAGALKPVLHTIDTERIQKQLHEYAVKIPELRTIRHDEIVWRGSAIEAIHDVVQEKEIGLVIVGSHGRSGPGKIILGSVAEATIRRLRCPVLVVGPCCMRRFRPLSSMLFATGLPVSSLRAAQYAMSIAQGCGATLTVVHVLPVPIKEAGSSCESKKRNAVKELRQIVPNRTDLKRRVHFEIPTGEPVKEILRIARDTKAGLIVMGVREGATLADHAPWSILSEIIREAHCPVLAVQPHLV